MKKALVIAGLTAVLGTAGGLLLTQRGQGATGGPQNVTPSELAFFGITLSNPQTPTPSAANAQAAAAAVTAEVNDDSAVTQQNYMHCSDTNDVPAVNEDCWVISLKPTDVPFGGSTPAAGDPAPAKWALALVDPSTDKIIHLLASSS